jgi:hypothetical protein
MSSHRFETHTPKTASGMTSRSIAGMAINSGLRFISLARRRALSRPPNRLGQAVRVDDERNYQVFRETVSDAAPVETPNVLVVGFQLKVIGAHPLPHAIFQRCCLLTTPFWSGLPGFGVKLWMVDSESKRYLGIYDWRGTSEAQRYVDALVRVLQPLSTPGSVWYRLLPDRMLDAYLAEHAADSNPIEPGIG